MGSLTEPLKHPTALRNAGLGVAEDAEIEGLLREAGGEATHGEIEIRVHLLHGRHPRQTGFGAVSHVDRGLVEVGGSLAEVGVVEVVVVAKGVVTPAFAMSACLLRGLEDEVGCT